MLRISILRSLSPCLALSTSEKTLTRKCWFGHCMSGRGAAPRSPKLLATYSTPELDTELKLQPKFNFCLLNDLDLSERSHERLRNEG